MRKRARIWIACIAVLAVACNRGGTPTADQPASDEAGAVSSGDPGGDPTSNPPSLAAGGGWTVSADELGMLRVRNRWADVLRGHPAFFGPAFKWADTESEVTRSTPTEATTRFRIADLGIQGTTKLTLAEAGGTATATMEWNMRLSRRLEGISGGGLEMQMAANPTLWGGGTPTPDLSSDGKTLKLGAGTDKLTFELDTDGTTFAAVGPPGLFRIVLLANTIEAGDRKVTLKVTLPDGGRVGVGNSREETPGPDWPADTLVFDGWPVDLSFLQDKPAGKHGHVRVAGEALEFSDGTPARFWGTNVIAFALFSEDKAAIAKQAKRISAMGFNLVRLHHHDSGWVSPNVFEPGSRRLRKASLGALDWWIKCLADEGVYVWIDVHVGRVFRESDGIGGFAELPQGDGRGFSYVNPRIATLMDEFASAYLDRTNAHTGRTIASDPAVAMIQITNENDITHHFGAMMDPGSDRPIHEALFRKRVEAFATAAGVPVEASLRAWEPGPAKLALADIEHQWSRAAIAHIRKLGVRVPISTTSIWGDESIYSLPSLLAGDVVDVHSYGLPEALSANPHFEPNFVSVASVAAVVGKPHTASELSVPPPANDRYIATPYMAAIAAFQSWDAPMLFSYGSELQPHSAQTFTAWIDPSLIGPAPAAAVLYRRGDVAPAKNRIVIAPTAKEVYGEARHVFNSAALRTGVELSQVVIAVPDAPQLDWDRAPDLAAEKKKGARVVTDLDLDLLPADATRVVSDTGEMTRDFVEGRWTLATARSKVASGWIGGAQIDLGDSWVELENPGATFALTALDDAPITTSKRILVTAVGPAAPVAANSARFRSAPMRGRFAIRTSEKLELVPLAATTGSSGGDLSGRVGTAGKREGDMLVFDLAGKVATHWWILRAAK